MIVTEASDKCIYVLHSVWVPLGLSLDSCYMQKSREFGFSSVLFLTFFFFWKVHIFLEALFIVCFCFFFKFISGLTVATILFGIIRSLLLFQVLVNSGQNLHNKMFQSILKAPVLFFDRNPIGKFISIKKPSIFNVSPWLHKLYHFWTIGIL